MQWKQSLFPGVCFFLCFRKKMMACMWSQKQVRWICICSHAQTKRSCRICIAASLRKTSHNCVSRSLPSVPYCYTCTNEKAHVSLNTFSSYTDVSLSQHNVPHSAMQALMSPVVDDHTAAVKHASSFSFSLSAGWSLRFLEGNL